MELGPLQQAWVDGLRAHPELQTTGVLGYKGTEDYPEGYCCLGYALLCIHEFQGTEPSYKGPNLMSTNAVNDIKNGDTLQEYQTLGLYSSLGDINTDHLSYELIPSESTLAALNDNGWTWPQIADFIEKYPEAVFTKSV